MKKEQYEITDQDVKFMIGTAEMIKDIVSHCIFSYTKDGKAPVHAILMKNIFRNAVGISIQEISERDSFVKNLNYFGDEWNNYIKQVEDQISISKKEVH